MAESTTTFSLPMLLLLLVLFFGSLAMFVVLEWRSTTNRRWVALSEWSRGRGMRMKRRGEVHAAMRLLSEAQPSVKLIFQTRGVEILQLQTSQPEARGWNVLVMDVRRWPYAPAGLRPVHQPQSVLDLMNLPVMPTAAGTERFVALSNEGRSARALVLSKTRALLPPDVAVLRIDYWLVLDFSTRPFDPIELDRMLAVAKQISQLG